MPGTVGGDLQDLTRLASTLRTSGHQVSQLKTGLDRAVQSAVWTGPAAARFRSDWQRFAPVMVKLQHALEDAAREVGRRREAIERATS
jgi:WXG100 family type VII secretion target